jgi:hypothetical protein
MDATSQQPGPLPAHLVELIASARQEASRKADEFRWDPVSGRTFSGQAPQTRDPRPLNVLLVRGGKSMFRYLDDERVRLSDVGEAVDAAPDLVVVAQEQALILDRRTLELPEEIWARLRSGAAKLVIDSSGEGAVHSAERFSRLHAFFERIGIAPSNCILLTQDRAFRTDYLEHARALGLGGQAMQVLVHDRFIQYLFSAARTGGEEALFYRRARAYASSPPDRARRFISLNHKMVYPHRALFLLRLLRDGLWDSGHISVGPLHEYDGKEITRGQFIKRVCSDPRLFEEVQAVLPELDRLDAYAPRFIGLEDTNKGTAKELFIPDMYEEYTSSWFSVVIETDTTARLHRVTEKPFKPLLCFHPLIVLGGCFSLELIRDFGFRTFPELFDESYDSETDLLTRFRMVYGEVERLCRMDQAELARRHQAAEEAVVFNAWWGLTQLPALFRDRVDTVLVDWLIALARGEASTNGAA